MAETVKRSQCPECAEQGRDNSGNNLSWFHNQYGKLTAKCVAGCAYKPNREEPSMYVAKQQEIELINSGIYQDIPERKLSKDICELYSYQVGNYGNKQVHIENYYQEDVLVAQKIRTIKPKKFIWQGHADSIGFFGEHLHNKQTTLWITEGAIDTLSLVETMKKDAEWVSKNLVVSLKEGAGKGKTKNELKRRLDFLDVFDKIVLAFDTDKAGLLSFAESLKLFEPGKIWTIDYKFKDANEYLLNGAREQLEEDIRTITRYRPPSIRIPSLEGLLKPEPMGLQLPFPLLNDMIRGFKQGRIYTFAGGSGLGKSSVTKKITYELMKQDPTLKVGVAYLEEPLETTGRSFIAMDNDVPLYKLEEEPDHISFEKFQESYHTLMSSERLFTVDASFMSLNGDDLLYTLEYLIKVEKCELIILDHLTMITYDQVGEQSERKDIDILMKKLKVLAHNTKAKIVVVVHLKRPSNGLAWDHGRELFATDLRGCVDSETEFLTPTGWKKISNWNNDIVGSYNPENKAVLFEHIDESNYIVKPVDRFYHIKSIRGIDQVVSPEHRMLFQHGLHGYGETLHEYTAEEYVKRHNKSKTGNRARFRTTYGSTIQAKKFNEWELRLSIAFQADGTISKRPLYHVFKFTKERKYFRLKRLLDKARLHYKDYGKFQCGQYCIETILPIAFKQFPEQYWKIGYEEAKIVIDEMKHWDGAIKTSRYCSINKYNVDFIQHCFSLIGIRSTIYTCKRTGKWSTLYHVSPSKNNTVALANKDVKPEIKEYTSHNGLKYCFTTTTGAWIARRNGRVFITGNSASLEQLSDAIIGLEANRFDNMAKSLTKLKVVKNRVTGKLGYADVLVYLENTGQLKVMNE